MPSQKMPIADRRCLLLVTTFAMISSTASADQSDQGDDASYGPGRAEVMDEVVVVANKRETSRRNVAANVSVFDAEDFRFELAGSIADVFRYAPGIDYESDRTRFGAESINIRGIAGNRVAILIDGVPVSDQFDVGNFSNATRDLVNAGFVDQIEVLHGPASALYGSAAIGGVVAMQTIDPRSVAGPDSQGGGLFSNWREDDSSLGATAMHAIATGAVTILAGLSSADGHEFDASAADSNLDRREFENRSALLKFVADDPRGNYWQAVLYHKEGSVQSDARSLLGSGRFRSTTALLGDDDHETDFVAAEYRFPTANPVMDDGVVRGWYQASEFVQRTRDERALAVRPVRIDRLFSFQQQAIGIEANGQKAFLTGEVDHRLSYGLEVRRRETEEYRDGLETGMIDGAQTSVLLGEVFPLRDFPVSRTDEWGVFVEDTMSLRRWSITAALRADHYEMRPDVDAMYAEDYPFARPVSISESEVSPKAGLIYRLGHASEIYLQYSHGFRAPPYEDANISLELPLFNIRAVPNPELRSERSDGLDLGMRWRGTRGGAYVSMFRTEYEDFIESRVPLGPDPESGRFLFQSQNIAAAVIEGIEAGGTVEMPRIAAGIFLDSRVFLARSENRDNGQPLNSVGPPQATASVNWQSPGHRVQASLRATFTDDWSALDESGGQLFEAPGYGVLDLYLAFRPGRSLTLRAGVRNLTDKTYWAWTDIRGLAPDNPVIPYLSGPGRSFTAGFDMAW